MSEAIKPTRGPWFTDESQPGDLYRYVMHGDGDSFGYVCRISTNGNANPESDARLIAEAGTVRHETGLSPRQLVERVKELEEALQRLLGPADDPNAGWRGAGGTDVLFACEHCRATSEDSTKIEHADDCPIAQARAALSKALPNTVAEVK